MNPTLFPLGDQRVVGRRAFVGASLSFAAAALLSNARLRAASKPSFSADPFSLGIASGDPTPDGVVQFRDDIYNRDGLGAIAATQRG